MFIWAVAYVDTSTLRHLKLHSDIPDGYDSTSLTPNEQGVSA